MLSHDVGAADISLLDTTVGQALDEAAEKWPDREALVCPEQGLSLTWRELRLCSEQCAAGLLELGLTTGDRIGVWSLNRPEWTITRFATARAGLILVTVNPAYRLSELDFVLKKVGCKALVIAPPFKTSNYADLVRQLAPEVATCAPGKLRAAALPALRLVARWAATYPGASCPSTT